MHLREQYNNYMDMFKNLKLATKLILILITVSIVPLVIAAVVNYNVSSKALEKEYVDSNKRVLYQGGDNLSNIVNDLVNISSGCYYDGRFIDNVEFDISDYANWKYNNDLLQSMLFSNNSLNELQYYVIRTQDLLTYSTKKSMFKEKSDLSENIRIQRTIDSKNGYYIGQYSTESGTFSLNRMIKSIGTGKIYAILTLYPKIDNVQGICDSMCDENEWILLFNTDGEKIYSNISTDTEDNTRTFFEAIDIKEKEGHYLITSNGTPYLYFFKKIAGGLTLVKLIPFRDITRSARASIEITVIIALILLLVMVFLSIIFSRTITKPLRNLVQSVNIISSGNYAVEIKQASNDEVGELTKQFNVLAERLDDLVNKNLRTQLAETQATLNALQLQVNPHFIFNALQSIGTLALKNNSKDVYSALIKLASLMRYNYSGVGMSVNLGEELKDIKNYIEIQKIRFGDDLKLEFDIDEDSTQCIMPKLILQPIVENVIKHAFYNTGTIIIRSILDQGKLVLEISDNGKGIPKDTLKRLRKEMTSDSFERKTGIGLSNTYRRLKLIYGSEFDLSITSDEGTGTCVVIQIPLNYEERKS